MKEIGGKPYGADLKFGLNRTIAKTKKNYLKKLYYQAGCGK
jgi:hypothetical protein